MRTFLFLGGSILGLTAPAHAQDVQDAGAGADEMVLASDAFEIDEDAITITVTGNPSEVEDTGQPVTVIGCDATCTTCTECTSIGSPRLVPVPCASSRRASLEE